MNERVEELKAKIKARIKKDKELLAQLDPVQEMQIERYTDLEKRVALKPKVPRYETGLEWFDRHTGGIEAGTFINLAGQAFGGKTTMVLKILANISEYKETVLFSFEMYENKLVKRLQHLNDTQKHNLLIVQTQYKIEEIDAIVRKKAKDGVKFFAIDSRMKVQISIDGKEYQKIAYLSNHLSKLCQELGIIIILINQISEDNLKTGRLSLKGSGDQSYDSDMMLYIIVKKEKDGEEKRLCICDKDRDGGKKWVEDITEPNVVVREYQE